MYNVRRREEVMARVNLENMNGAVMMPCGKTQKSYYSARHHHCALAITSSLRRTLYMVLFITYHDDLGWAIRPGCTPAERTRINDFIRSTFFRAGWVLSETKSIFDNTGQKLLFYYDITTNVFILLLQHPKPSAVTLTSPNIAPQY